MTVEGDFDYSGTPSIYGVIGNVPGKITTLNMKLNNFHATGEGTNINVIGTGRSVDNVNITVNDGKIPTLTGANAAVKNIKIAVQGGAQVNKLMSGVDSEEVELEFAAAEVDLLTVIESESQGNETVKTAPSTPTEPTVFTLNDAQGLQFVDVFTIGANSTAVLPSNVPLSVKKIEIEKDGTLDTYSERIASEFQIEGVISFSNPVKTEVLSAYTSCSGQLLVKEFGAAIEFSGAVSGISSLLEGAAEYTVKAVTANITGVDDKKKQIVFVNGVDGNDDNDGSTAEKAVKTLSKAYQIAVKRPTVPILLFAVIQKSMKLGRPIRKIYSLRQMQHLFQII